MRAPAMGARIARYVRPTPRRWRRRGRAGSHIRGGERLGSSPSGADSPDQPLRDGCQRSDFGIGFDTSPEWVYVYRQPVIRMATGVVRVARGSLQDSILQHRSFDFNANLVPDAPYRYLIAEAGRRVKNNFAPGGGEEQGRLPLRVGERDDAVLRVADRRRPRRPLGIMDLGLRPLAGR